MNRKYYEDLTFYQRRKSLSEKRRFRDYVQKQARDLGLRTSIYPEIKSCKNVIVGDLKSAEYVICAHYDTAPRLLPLVERNYTYCHKFLEFLSLIIGVGLLILFYFLNILWLGIASFIICIILFLRLAGALTSSRRFSYNDNTSGIITVLNLMDIYKDFNQRVAYVFLDNKEKGLAGSKALSKMMQSQKMIVQKEDKKFIFLDCVGLGKDFTISWYRETKFVDRLKDLFLEKCDDKYTITLKEDSKVDVNDYMSFKRFDHASITCYKNVDKKKKKFLYKNIKPVNDSDIDLKNIEFLSSVLSEYIMNNKGV